MDTDKLVLEDSKTDGMPSTRLNLLKKLKASIYPFLNYLTYCVFQYSPATLLASYLLYVTYSSMVFVILIVVAVLAFMYSFQDSLLYHPNTPADSRYFVESPAKFGLPHEDVFLQTRDGLRLHAYLIKQPAPHLGRAFTFVFLHGNAGNIGHRLLNANHLYGQCRVNIFLLDYRGYGRSEGTPSEEGLLKDAASAVEYVSSRSDLDGSKVVLFGRSLGGAVAVGSTSAFGPRGPIAGLILENTFTSIVDMAKSIFKVPIFDYWPTFLIKNKFPSLDRIADVQAPILFISGLQDELVPPSMMRLLFERSRSVMKRLFLCQAGTHNESWRCHGYYEQINNFLREVESIRDGGEVDPSRVVS